MQKSDMNEIYDKSNLFYGVLRFPLPHQYTIYTKNANKKQPLSSVKILWFVNICLKFVSIIKQNISEIDNQIN